MDTANSLTVRGFETDEGAIILDAGKSRSLLASQLGIGTGRRIEFFGDSVSCGELSEAVLFTGKNDPPHNGEYSNSWYSYAWMTARKVHAQIHDTSQGGISLLSGSGYYHEDTGADGMDGFYDKCQPNRNFGQETQWDLKKWVPQVVVIALGQNDNHPADYMKEDYRGQKARTWREAYRDFLSKLMKLYPKAHIVCTTTVLIHDTSWDLAIDEVVRELDSERVSHFLYDKNGTGTPGHIRVSEADQMSDELADYIYQFFG